MPNIFFRSSIRLITLPLLVDLLSIVIGSRIFFIVSTNSVRTTPAIVIIRHVEKIISVIRAQHTHPFNKHDISITSPFPCLRTSACFPALSLLSSNIEQYRVLLQELSIRLNLSFVDLGINNGYLNNDGIHLKPQYGTFLFYSIRKHFDEIVRLRSQPSPSILASAQTRASQYRLRSIWTLPEGHSAKQQ